MKAVFIRRNPPSIALIVLAGIALSILAAVTVARQERANYRLRFQRETDGLTTSLQRSINRYTDLLLAIGDFYGVSDQAITRDEFNRFVARSLTSYSGIQALEWAPVVAKDERAKFEAVLREAGYAEFEITERSDQGSLKPAEVRSHYVPVTYLQPWEGNELALGYDLTSDMTRRVALEFARDSGRIAASGRIRLVQERKDQFGFLVFAPLYEGQAVPSTQMARREQVEGYLLGVFRVADVVEEAVETLDYDIDFSLSDRTAKADEQFLGTYHSLARTVVTQTEPQRSPTAFSQSSILCPTDSDCIQTVTAGDREWAIAFSPATSYPALITWRALATLVIGLLLTALVSRSLAQAQAELHRTQEVSKLKIRLFSMASHELRTPLSTILVSAQMLETMPVEMPVEILEKASAVATDRQKIQSRIRVAAKQMNRLLNDLLLLARAESGKLAFSPEIINLTQFCQQLIEEVRFSLESPPSIELITVGEPSEPHQIVKEEQITNEVIYADPHLLRAIVTNLLSNALKYSRSKVTLTLSYQSHEIALQVKDSGIGIPEADSSRLVETFYRGSNVGNIAGTGLGLSVVTACLQLHKGQLSYESNRKEGTTFTVVFPRIE
ncbi:MAG: CHASE domain-containing protein [Cyanobacteria bacterium P01_D01_bin.1]